MYADVKKAWKKGFIRGFIAGIVLVLLAIFMLAYTENAIGQVPAEEEANYTQKIQEIMNAQQLPADVEKLPYLSYASPKGAYTAWQDMPKPVFIVKKIGQIAMGAEGKNVKTVVIYRVYFTPKPDTIYNIPEGKIVRYEKTSWIGWSAPGGDGYVCMGSGWGIGISHMHATYQDSIHTTSFGGNGYAPWRLYKDYWERKKP